MRGVVPPCTDEAPEGTWGGCVEVGGGSQTSRGQAQLKTGRIEETEIRQRVSNKGGTKANEKKAAHQNNDLILENMHNMISFDGGSDPTHGYATLPPRLRPQELRVQRERDTQRDDLNL